jgi:hypothetical protein
MPAESRLILRQLKDKPGGKMVARSVKYFATSIIFPQLTTNPLLLLLQGLI